MSRPTLMVRAVFRAIAPPAELPGAQALSCRVYYPAEYTGSDLEKNTGALPAVAPARPYPVAILMPGINVSPDAYGWLAQTIVRAGFIAVTYGWVAEEMPGMVALSPGLDVNALKPDEYGTRPSATALAAVIDDLAAQNRSGPLAGLIDLERILLGGHSAGGSVALLNARPGWFAGLKAVFSYGAHSKASTMLGYPANTLLTLPDALPTLIMSGSQDGVIASSDFRYGADADSTPDPIGPVRRTFDEGLRRNQQDCYLAVIAGANHFSACWPADTSTGRPFLDWPEQRPNEAIRADISDLVSRFARAHVDDQAPARDELVQLLNDRTRIAESGVR